MATFQVQVRLELWRNVTVTAETLEDAEQYARNAARFAPFDGVGHGSAYAQVTADSVGRVEVTQADVV